MPVYEVISSSAELPRLSIFAIAETRIETGSLILASINDFLIIGRWFPNIIGLNWILQPGRIIRITGRAVFKILGVIGPFEPFTVGINLN